MSVEASRASKLVDQVNRNLVALISLVLAITSLTYTAWRNETTEVQRNHRQAAFQILVEAGELRQIILTRRYFVEPEDRPTDGSVPLPANWVAGWGKVTMLRDLTSVLPAPLPDRGEALFEAWDRRAAELHQFDAPDQRAEAASHLLDALDEVQRATVELVRDLS